MIRGVIFDFDGLFIESEVTAYQAWQELYASFGQTLPLNLWLQVIGTYDADFDPTGYLEDCVGHELDWEALEPPRRVREWALADELTLLPGVIDRLDESRELGLRCAVASSSSQLWVLHHLKRLGVLNRFEAVCTRDDVVRTKPDPALYLLALERLGLQASDAVAFEDSPNGLAAALAAGLRCVIVPSELTRGADFSGATVVVDSLATLCLRTL